MEIFTYFAASDIHGNIQALDEIIRLAKKEKADRLFIAGDLCPGDPSFALRLHNAPLATATVCGISLTADWLFQRKAFILKCRMGVT